MKRSHAGDWICRRSVLTQVTEKVKKIVLPICYPDPSTAL